MFFVKYGLLSLSSIFSGISSWNLKILVAIKKEISRAVEKW